MDSPQGITSERYAGLAYQTAPGHFALAAGSTRKAVDTDRHSVTAVLTFPVADLAGDVVDPAGCDFGPHELAGGPVDVEHSRTRAFGDLVVAKSVAPDGTYAVAFRTLDVGDGTRARLPVGTSYFDPSSKASMQVFGLVERDILPGVSLEFKALSGKPLGPSPLENRQAYAFSKVAVVRYTHCATPVNPGALTVTKSLDALIPVAQTGRIGGEALDPRLLGVLRKSIARYTPARVLVTSGFKAVDEPDTLYDDPAVTGETPDQSPSGPPTNGITALYAHVEGLLDLCDQLEEDIQATDSPDLLKQAEKFCEMGRALAEKAKAAADKHDEKLRGGTADKPEGESEADADDAEPDMDRDEGKTLKAIRPCYRVVLKALRAKRFSLAEIRKAEAEKPADDDAAGDTAEDLAREERATKKYRRAERIYG